MSAGHATQPREDLCWADKWNLARDLTAALNRANTLDEFGGLILVASAHAPADLHQALDAPIQRKIAAQRQKDLTKVVPDTEPAERLADLSSA